jgi:prepilin-type N-terminal cleavage/methylation domain-containing protein
MRKAYTLIEILIVIGILGAVAAVLMPLGINQLRGEKVVSAMANMTSNIYSMQQSALARKNNSAYGVRFTTNNYYLFAGNSYATATDIEIVPVENGISISNIQLDGGSTEFVFLAGSFRPSRTGTVTMTDNLSTYVFTINAEGLLYSSKQ